MEYIGVVDRIEDGEKAVVLVEEDGGSGDESEYILDIRNHSTTLSEGMVVEVYIEQGEIVSISPDAEATKNREERITNLFNRVSNPLPDRSEDEAE